MADPSEDREFQELYPGQGVADLPALYEPSLGPGRDRHVRVNMVASVDGGTAIAGTSGSLGGAADREVFATIRSFADVIVVGAATVRAEHYGPPRVDARHRRARLERGQAPAPAIALVTRNPDLDWQAPVFADADVPPFVITAATAPRPPAEIATVVVAATGGQLDFGLALDELVARGLPNILIEGGPTINGQFAAADTIDELCLTTSPMLLVGSSHRIFAGPELAAVSRLTLASVVTADDFLFVRYARAEPPASG